MIELDKPDYWHARKVFFPRFFLLLCTKSLESCSLMVYHIFWQSSVQRGRHTNICIIRSLKWIIQIVSTFCYSVSKSLSTHPIEIVWGNFPFKIGLGWGQTPPKKQWKYVMYWGQKHIAPRHQCSSGIGNWIEINSVTYKTPPHSLQTKNGLTPLMVCLHAWKWNVYRVLVFSVYHCCLLCISAHCVNLCKILRYK